MSCHTIPLQEDLDHALLVTDALATPLHHTALERTCVPSLLLALCTLLRGSILCAFTTVNLLLIISPVLHYANIQKRTYVTTPLDKPHLSLHLT
jgi:hypothetical protein